MYYVITTEPKKEPIVTLFLNHDKAINEYKMTIKEIDEGEWDKDTSVVLSEICIQNRSNEQILENYLGEESVSHADI